MKERVLLRLKSMSAGVIAWLILFLSLIVQPAFAQDIKDSIAGLPGPRDPENFGITQKNVELFKEMLLAPLAGFLKRGNFIVFAVRELDFAWRLSPEFEKSSEQNPRYFELNSASGIETTSDTSSVFGLPFGLAGDVDKEKDPERRAIKILWNSTYAQGATQDVLYDLEFAWTGTRSLMRTSDAVLFKRFFKDSHVIENNEQVSTNTNPTEEVKQTDGIISKDAKVKTDDDKIIEGKFSDVGDVMYQEVLKFLSPPVVLNLTHSTWRFRGYEDDRVWIFSSVLNRLRQVLPANRGDGLLGGAMSLDDFGTFGAKIQTISAKVVDEKVLLLPFPSVNPYRLTDKEFATSSVSAQLFPQTSLDRDENLSSLRTFSSPTVSGFHKRIDGQMAMALWNFNSNQYPGGSPWIPLTVRFVPRRVWIIELSPKDPYYVMGRQILIVDKESFLPFYKLVYDQKGSYLKTVITGWGLATTDNGDIRFPFIGFSIAADASTEQAMIVTTKEVRTFRENNAVVEKQLATLFSPIPKVDQK